MLTRTAIFGSAVLAITLAGSAVGQTVRVYAVQHRTADELAPLVETALAGEGRVAADRRTNALVLSGSPRAVATALELLAALDVRARTVVLRYESRRSGELASAGANVRWRAGAGSFRVGDVRWAGEAARDASTLAGELRILEGQSGRIASGSSLPVTARRIRHGRYGAVVEESTRYVAAESGFEASPRVLRDGRVELALRPFDASPRPDGAIARASADTVLVLEPGATVALGGITRERSAHSGGPGAADASTAGEESLLLVTVALE